MMDTTVTYNLIILAVNVLVLVVNFALWLKVT